jgi:hypothetical protein
MHARARVEEQELGASFEADLRQFAQSLLNGLLISL